MAKYILQLYDSNNEKIFEEVVEGEEVTNEEGKLGLKTATTEEMERINELYKQIKAAWFKVDEEITFDV